MNNLQLGTFEFKHKFYNDFYENDNGGGIYYVIPMKFTFKCKIEIIKLTKKQVRYNLYVSLLDNDDNIQEEKSYLNEIRKVYENNTFQYPKWFFKDFKTSYKNGFEPSCGRDFERDSSNKVKKFINITNEIKQKNAVSTISNWFLECKYNPKYKYCKDILNKLYDEEF